MNVLRTVPAVLAALLLGAHFLRGQHSLLVGACVVLAVLAIVPDERARLLTRILLCAGVLVWLQTAWSLAQTRIAAGAPYARMVLILAGVAAFTLLAAALLPSRRRPLEPALKEGVQR